MLKTDEDSSAPTKKIKTLYELYQLSQLIDEATRVTMTTSSLIDHIWCYPYWIKGTLHPQNKCRS